jgi:hypothetical protein
MRTKLFIGSSMICCILLVLHEDAQPQTHNKNLHRTVTHRSDPTAKVTVPHHSHKEGTMPKNDKDFGIYAARVTLFKQFLEKELPDTDKRGLIHGVPLSTYNYHKWTEQDVRVIATSFNSYEQFQSLLYMKNSAGAKDENGQYTEEALCAQNALTELKPDSCKSWKSFFNMIVRVEKDTESERAALKIRKDETRRRIDSRQGGTLIDLHKNDNIAGDPMENPAFDQQAALSLLERNAVKIDAEHSLKSPDPKAVALEAVKALKGAVRSA